MNKTYRVVSWICEVCLLPRVYRSVYYFYACAPLLHPEINFSQNLGGRKTKIAVKILENSLLGLLLLLSMKTLVTREL